MINGAKFWNDKSKHHIQTNNPSEEILKKAKVGLESCGPTACACCLDAMGVLPVVKVGKEEMQAEEIIMDTLNNPANYKTLSTIRAGISPGVYYGNRVPQYYPWVVSWLYDITAQYLGYLQWERLIDHAKKGQAVQLCLMSPGHYIAAIAYDDGNDTIIYNDPWPGRPGNKRNGFNEVLTKAEFELNVYRWGILYL